MRLNENAGHPDQQWTVGDMHGRPPDPSDPCDPPVPGPEERAWVSIGTTPPPPLHNAPYTLTASYTYVVGPMPFQYLTDQLAIELSFANLVVAVVEDATHPPVLLWHPTDAQKRKCEVAFTLSSRQQETVDVTLSVYDLSRPDDAAPVRRVVLQDLTAIVGGEREIWTWDGRNDQGQTMPKGVYPFVVTAMADPIPQDMIDRDKSSHLTLQRGTDGQGQPAAEAEPLGYDEQAGTQDFLVRYGLHCQSTRTDNDGDHRWDEDPVDGQDNDGDLLFDEDPQDPADATQGELIVHDPDFQVWQADLSTLRCETHSTEQNEVTDGLHATLAGEQHALVAKVPAAFLAKVGKYDFAIRAKDAHGHLGRSHANKWALECGQLCRWNPDLDTDSDNDGDIDEDDDPIEADADKPGRIVALNDDDDNGNGIPDLTPGDDEYTDDDMVEVILRAVPMTPDNKLTLRCPQGGAKIRVWPNQYKGPGEALDLPHEFEFGGGDISVWVEGLETSAAPGDVVLELVGTVDGEEYVDVVRLTVARLRLKEATFGGPHHPVVRDNGAGQYVAPHWLDNNEDGDGKDPGDQRYPVCYTRDTRMQVAAKVLLAPPDLFPGPFQIRGDGPGAWDVSATGATVNGIEITIPLTECPTPFLNEIDFFNPMEIKWELSPDGGATWLNVGKSDDRVYVMLANPVANSLYETIVDIGCRNADGKSNANDGVTAIWGDFQGPIPGVRRKVMDGDNNVDGVNMRYWLPANSTPQTLAGMLASPVGNGSCVAWSELLHETVRAQGIPGSQIYEVQASTIVNPDADGFLVKNWNFGHHVRTGPLGGCETAANPDDFQAIPEGPAPPDASCVTPGPNGTLGTAPGGNDVEADGLFAGTAHPYLLFTGQWGGDPAQPYGDQAGDVANQPGVAGQHNAEPPEFFYNHYVVRYGIEIYDPSYGAGPFADELAHETTSILGIKATLPVGPCARRDDPARQELIYIPR